MKLIKLLSIILILGFFCSCKEQQYTASYVDVYNTYSTLTAQAKDKETFDDISNNLHKELLRLHKLFDIYNNYEDINNIKTINDNAGIQPVKVDKDLLNLIKLGKEAYTRTDGTINIAMGSVLKIWHTYRENAQLNNISAIPTEEELKEASMHTDVNSIVIDEANSTVYITDKNTSIDVGAIAKGYSADYSADFLKKQGITVALLNLGGNVICLNDNTKESWKVGITSPDNTAEYIDTLEISNKCAVSSGNYQQYYEYEGKIYSHIIDNKTLFPAENNKSVTIVTDSALDGDIFSTALYILPYEKGKNLAETNNLKVVWITADDTMYKTKN